MDKLIIKNFVIDYSFILKNYLNPEMWQKNWTLFVYKGFSFKLNISSIDTENEKIWFKITLNDSSEDRRYYNSWGNNGEDKKTFDYSLKINDISFLKRKIKSKMLDCIYDLEIQAIVATADYLELKDSRYEEERKLREIAEEFLDKNNVTNEDIRDAYIDVYVENNKKIDTYLEDYKDENIFKILTELYLIFAKVNDDEDLIKKLEETTDLSSLKKEIDEYLEYMETEEFEDEMKNNLEEI